MKKPRIVSLAIREYFFQLEMLAHRRRVAAHRGRSGTSPSAASDPLLVGYFEIGFGLGQYVRGLASALKSVEQPFAAYPYDVDVPRARLPSTWGTHYDIDGAHDINVFCMAVNQTPAAWRILGRRRTARSYNILNTFWELSRAPRDWSPLVSRFDEMWLPNEFVAAAMRPIFSGPITIIPPCVELAMSGTSNRAAFDLDPERFWFMFSFDYNSYPERKNPLAVVEAFGRAFGGGDENVGLIVKSNGDAFHHPRVVAAIDEARRRDSRIRCVHGEMPRGGMLDLMASIDCYVSLHRSEGFGFGMAEAMLMGIPVIGTSYSGNADFLREDTGFPVPYALTAIEGNAYPHAAGQVWADPDIEHASRLMRDVVANPKDTAHRRSAGRAEILKCYAPEVVGATVSQRLDEIRRIIAGRRN